MFMKDSAWKSWYHDRHISLCIQRTGNEFEAYVTSILKLFYGGEFINPDPSVLLGMVAVMALQRTVLLSTPVMERMHILQENVI